MSEAQDCRDRVEPCFAWTAAHEQFAEDVVAFNAEIGRLRELLAECEAVLGPFASAYEFWSAADGAPMDDDEVDDQGAIRMADFRGARALATKLRAALSRPA